ncbi:5-methylcytosine restriction system specificity protein McrC [Pedobacter psychroterrae]|uniref:Restriction endonuclease n=1 Tax=Pedobacter psychroterrae TaxID=2530453 RepID=A0A4R0NIC7_9SPHI|nr:restriction endonuclease [Pedobacter psychroterrae]TCC99978.1 restriction endonuclease [Pedobacter psychroterrae]
MEIEISEHKEVDLLEKIGSGHINLDQLILVPAKKFPTIKETKPTYFISEKQNSYFLKADYYIGVDWIIQGKHFVLVKPKLNKEVLERFDAELKKWEEQPLCSENESELDSSVEKDNSKQLNYLKLLMDAFQHPVIVSNTNNLVLIDWDAEQIVIKQEDDALTPFLVVQFLNLLKHIVRKGLKKSYYKVKENLDNRIKGKILVGANIKQNILKNRLTKTYCEYQEFGVNHQENRFLKNVLYYCSNYVHQNAGLFAGNQKDLEQLINYCKPAFELVNDKMDIATLKNSKNNPFFKEYKDAIKIGQYILKRFAYNISNTAKSQKIKTPPFWIDMPKLFELYVYHHLLSAFSESEIKFQFSTYGNALDFLITKEGSEMVVDAKYKMHYRSSQIHGDIRQVAGYARLNKVYETLEKTKTPKDIIDCLIIYPTDEVLTDDYKFECVLNDSTKINAYHKVFKIGIPMPYIK